MEKKMPATDCAFLLERKLFQSASIDDLGYFLRTSDAHVPQVISAEFAGRFRGMIDRAINANDLQSVSTLTQVLSHVVQQDLTHSIQHLISSNLHSNFEPMVDFYLRVICDKNCYNSGAIKPFLLLISAIVDYSRKLNDHFSWLIQNMLHVILLILADPNVTLSVKMQTSEKFLSIFEDDSQVSPGCRAFVEKNEQLFDELSKRVLGSLHRSGHLQLQELIIEIIIRMWMTEIRKRKAVKWFDNNQAITATFLAISYDEFDYGVRMFLNQINSSTVKRRILTLSYKELQIGKQIFVPSNQWCNYVDLCYGSKILDVRYPYEEGGLQDEHKCSWKLGSIKSYDLVSFCVSGNLASQTVDLHLRFREPTCRVLTDFSLENQTALNLIIRFNKTMHVDVDRMTHFISSLFGAKYLVKQSAICSVPKHSISSSGPWAVFGPQNEAVDASFIQLSQESRMKNTQTPEIARNPSSIGRSKCTDHIAPQRVSIPSQRTNLAAKASQRQSESQVSMMKGLAIQAAGKRNSGETAKPIRHTSVATWHYSEEAPVLLKGMPKNETSQTPKIDQKQTQRAFTPTVHYINADIHRRATTSDSSSGPDQSGPPSKAQYSDETINDITSYNRLTSVPVSAKSQSGAGKSQIRTKLRLSEDAKQIVHETDSDCIHGDSSEEFAYKKKKPKTQRKEVKVDDIVPETQVALNTSIAKKPQHDTSAVGFADTSVDLMMQCLHGSGVSEQPPEIFDDEADGKGRDQTVADPSFTKRMTRLQKQKQSQENKDSGNRSGTSSRRSTKKKDASSVADSAASKVNDQFEKLVSQFKEKETVKHTKKQESVERLSEGGAKRSNVQSGRKKKRSLLDADVWQQLDEMVPVDQADDPATRSVRKRPYAEKFIKNIATIEKKEKTARGKQKNSTRKALKNLNIDPRQDKVKNQTAEVRKPAPVKKKRKKELPLPYDQLEEVVEITCNTQHDENILSPIDAVRDATFDRDVPVDLGSPIWVPSPQKKTVENVILSDIINSEERPKVVKKKSKVSFEPGAKTDGQNNKKASAGYFNPKRRKQARLFDSVSEATSGTASEPSWIIEHAAAIKETPKLEKTYKGARLRKRRERKKAIKKQSLEQVIDGSFHRSVSEERSDVSPVTNNSLLSGISLLQSLGSASNMDFDQIAAESDCRLSESGLEAAPTRLCDISDIRLEWNKLDLAPTADGDNIVHEGDQSEHGKKDDATSSHEPFSSTDYGSETEAKEVEEYHDLAAAEVNNNTPTESQDRFNFTEKIFANRKKAMTPVASPPPQKKFMKSKKKLEMSRPRSTTEDTSSSDPDVSVCDNSKAKALVKLMKNYARVIDKKWAEGHSQRADCIESYQSKIKKQVMHYETQMEGLEKLQDEAVDFVGYFNTSFNTIMKDAAKGLLESKLACRDLTARLSHHTRSQDEAMNELRRQISRDLKKQVAQVDKEDARGK